MAIRVLIVDDEPDILDLLSEILESAGFEVTSALNATEAMEQVKARIFDAAIVDFNLPDMNGVMLHRQIRQMDEELAQRTLFTSGQMQSDQDLDYYMVYGGGFLSKPFEIEQVLSALDKAING
jgi:two-component system NtrC family sensor kinase